jgi:hypothetical protein
VTPNTAAPFATVDVNFYGVHVGFLFSNQETDPAPTTPPGTRVGGRVRCGSVSLVMSSVASASGLTMYANLGEVVAQDDHE